MKKTVFFLLCVLTLVFSCQKDPLPQYPEEAPFLLAEDKNFKLPISGGTLCIPFSANRIVSAEGPEWCQDLLVDHDPCTAEEGKVTVSVTPNQTGKNRTGTVVLSAEGCNDVRVFITQLNRRLSSAARLKSLELKTAHNSLSADVRFRYDEKEQVWKGIYLKWIPGTAPQMLIPSFSIEGEEVYVDNVEVISGKTPVSFADDFTMTILAEDGTPNEVRISLNCPQINTELPVLHMVPDKIIDSKEQYVPTAIELYDHTPESKGTGEWDSKIQGKILMKGRGNSTWGLPKKPFRMKFPVKTNPIGLDHAKESNWVLLAQDMDKSLLRTYIAFAYSKELMDSTVNYHHPKASLFTPSTRFVNVYYTGQYYDSSKQQTLELNGDYLGVYQMCDRIDRGRGRLGIEQLTALDGNDPAKITGGYLVEADLHSGNRFSPYKGIKLTYKYPKKDDNDPSQYDYITKHIGQAEQALYADDFADPAKGWRQWFDEKTLADYIIIKELVGDMDGYTSTYLYKRRDCSKLFFGPIWDCDKGWRNDVRVPHWEWQPQNSLMIYAGFWMPPYVSYDWFQRFWDDPGFRRFVQERWQSKKADLLELTDRILDEMPVMMQKAIEANFSVWPFNYQYNGEAPMPQENYAAEIAYIRRLTVERAALLDREFAR